MKTALIGYTGFVGGNLNEQYEFTHLYNSKNYQEMALQEYELVVCAGISAVKWLANKDPEKDLSNIKVLEEVLSTVRAKQFILISTIDVYPVSIAKDEDFDCESVENHAYGKHRLDFEKFCNTTFENCLTVRLPGLFGAGLKKNVIYDLLNDNCLEMINPKSSFQYYYLKYLWQDIQKALRSGIKLMNFFSEPLPTQEIIEDHFRFKKVGQNPVNEGHYDLYTKYAKNWGNFGNYIYSKGEIKLQLAEFIEESKKVLDK